MVTTLQYESVDPVSMTCRLLISGVSEPNTQI